MEVKFVRTVEDRHREGRHKILLEVNGIRFESISVHTPEELERIGF